MTPFEYQRAQNSAAALKLATTPGAKYLGGGTNLVDLMRERIEQPASLIDVTGLERDILLRKDGSLLIGAAATNTAVATNPGVRQHAPLLAEAIVNGASGQIRNMATVGGNLLQRTRCIYFYDHASRCNKREPGTGCDAMEGHNRMHAILGASSHCVATHPSDMCVALAALGGTVHILGPSGERRVAFSDFHRLPGETPHIETALARGELITAIEVEAQPPGARMRYRKVRDRASYAFALVAVAAVLKVVDGTIVHARLALGAVAHKPWRSLPAESALIGSKADQPTFLRAASIALEDARPLAYNGFKIALAERVIAATFEELANSEYRP